MLLRAHGLNRLDDSTGDEIRVRGGVRTAILEVALVAAVDEAVRDADRGTTVGDAVRELVDRLRLVQAGEAEVILRAVNRDVFVHVFAERGHELLEVFLPAR